MIGSANWTLEPTFYFNEQVSVCSNSQVHKLTVQDGSFTYTSSQRLKGTNVRCITLDQTTVITDSQEHCIFGEQVVAIRNGDQVGVLGSTLSHKGRGVPVSVILQTNQKQLLIGYEDGIVTIDGKALYQSQSKVTGLCQTSSNDLWLANKDGQIQKVHNQTSGTLQIPCKTYEQTLNLKSHRLLVVTSPDNVEVLIVSGENGELYSAIVGQIDFSVNFEDQFVKASDNPHHMSLIQMIATENHQFICISYDRGISQWEVMPGGRFVEVLGYAHTIGSRVNQMQLVGNCLCVLQPQKLLQLNIQSLQTQACKLDPQTIIDFRLCDQIEGQLLLRFEEKLVFYSIITQEASLKFKGKYSDAILVDKQITKHLFSGQKTYQAQQSTKTHKQTVSDSLGHFDVVAILSQTSQVIAISTLLKTSTLIYTSSLPLFKLIQIDDRIYATSVNYTIDLLKQTTWPARLLHKVGKTLLFLQSDYLLIVQDCKNTKLAEFKLGSKFTHSCEILNRDMAIVLTEDGKLQIIDLQLETLLLRKQITCLTNTKTNLPFKVTALQASDSKVYFATDDKSIRIRKISEIMTEQQQLDKMIKASKPVDAVLTLFGIVRSRVFYQQKLLDTQKVTATLLSGERSDLLDLKLLRWTDSNRAEAVAVIDAELQSCSRVVRFEFYQKMIVLNLWLDLISKTPFRSEPYQQVRQDQTEEFNSEVEIVLQGGNSVSNFHLGAVTQLAINQVDAAIDAYSIQGLLCEALVLAKAFGDKQRFKVALKTGYNTFKQASDRQAQAQKLEAALKLI